MTTKKRIDVKKLLLKVLNKEKKNFILQNEKFEQKKKKL